MVYISRKRIHDTQRDFLFTSKKFTTYIKHFRTKRHSNKTNAETSKVPEDKRDEQISSFSPEGLEELGPEDRRDRRNEHPLYFLCSLSNNQEN